MRVNYTLPGLLPAETTPAETGRTETARSRAPQSGTRSAVAELEELVAPGRTTPECGVDRAAAPSRLFNVEDAATERLIWRQMLDRLVEAVGDAAPAGHSRPAATRQAG